MENQNSVALTIQKQIIFNSNLLPMSFVERSLCSNLLEEDSSIHVQQLIFCYKLCQAQAFQKQNLFLAMHIAHCYWHYRQLKVYSKSANQKKGLKSHQGRVNDFKTLTNLTTRESKVIPKPNQFYKSPTGIMMDGLSYNHLPSVQRYI